MPIVGGSILNHNHFQGGRAAFPMDCAAERLTFFHPDYPDIAVSHLVWPLTTLRFRGGDPEALTALADHVLAVWRGYSDPVADILHESVQNGQTVPHNTITPIARRLPDLSYQLDLVLRNNRTTPELPLGLFHPHPEIHAIKKENIGLIEVMGLAILPGRLKQELLDLREALLADPDLTAAKDPGHPLHLHRDWALALIRRENLAHSRDAALIDAQLQAETGRLFMQGLEHCGVFKQDETGTCALRRFLREAGFAVPLQGEEEEEQA